MHTEVISIRITKYIISTYYLSLQLLPWQQVKHIHALQSPIR